MKKLILLGVMLLNVVFGMDCNAMIERYGNNPSALIKSCTENHNADACFCNAALLSVMSKGDNNEAKYMEVAIKFTELACKLGKREACKILDEAGVEY